MITLNNVSTQQGEVKMGMLWYPNQDVDFLGRIDKIEKILREMSTVNQIFDDNSPYSVTELEAENKELRLRVDDLEELVITLSQELGDLQARVIAPSM